MSCIESSRERFSIFRNRSFTLFTLFINERDFRERSDFAAVSKSVSISMTNLLDSGLPVLDTDISPDFLSLLSLMIQPTLRVSPYLFAALSTSSEVHSDFQIWFHPGFPMQSRQARLDPYTASRDQIHHLFRLCCYSFFTCIFLRSFWHHLRKLCRTEMNKHKRWFHSSRMKFSFVSMFASWFLVSMYLSWILGSKLIRSNNQSSATLWVLETCLIVGLLLSINILITASLSSKMYNIASLWEEFVC